MQFPESWLREFCNPPLDSATLAETLTMGGFEVEERRPVAPPFTRIVVGEIKEAEQHPNADRLSVCGRGVGNPALVALAVAVRFVAALVLVEIVQGHALPIDQHGATLGCDHLCRCRLRPLLGRRWSGGFASMRERFACAKQQRRGNHQQSEHPGPRYGAGTQS